MELMDTEPNIIIIAYNWEHNGCIDLLPQTTMFIINASLLIKNWRKFFVTLKIKFI